MRVTLCAVGLCLVLGWPARARADLVTYSFGGVISDIADTSAPIDNVGGITIGSTFSGYFQYETNGAVDVDVADVNRGLYLLGTSGPASFFSVTVNGLTFTAGPGGVDVRNNVPSDLSPTTDFLNYTGGAVDTYPAGWSTTSPLATSLQAGFFDASGTLYSGDAIPTTFNPNDFDVGVLFLTFSNVTFPGGTDASVTITGDINLEAVPEPSSLIFGTVAAGGGLLLRRRRLASKHKAPKARPA
ncbi:MAG TPA: hypothetical protein VM452_02850 [Caulifigura sp.]|jgi:hypothetical protein|nr:hypothetical protein [Caulifigura sp.]